VLLSFSSIVVAQNGTPHGVTLTWSESSPNDAATGYNVYRCTGSCASNSGTWTKLTAMPVAALTYLDSTTLAPSTTYSYYATSVDASGNESAASTVATVAISSSGIPVNPSAPGGLAAAVK
jgi:chitin-binding protein